MDTNLTEPRYTQADVLKVTRLDPAVLQTWVNRSAIELSEQNPGSGRRRLYSTLDIVQLAVMRRMADMRIDLPVAKEVAEAAADELRERGAMDWNNYIFLRPKAATEESPIKTTIIMASGMSKLAMYGGTIGDPAYMRVSKYVEPDEYMFPRRRPRQSIRDIIENGASGDDEERPIIESRREELASHGIHAEPVIVFPIGEIVNGTLVQLRAIVEREQGKAK